MDDVRTGKLVCDSRPELLARLKSIASDPDIAELVSEARLLIKRIEPELMKELEISDQERCSKLHNKS